MGNTLGGATCIRVKERKTAIMQIESTHVCSALSVQLSIALSMALLYARLILKTQCLQHIGLHVTRAVTINQSKDFQVA